jgi:hypothetical protein
MSKSNSSNNTRFSIVRELGAPQTTLVVAFLRPSDGRPYYSIRRLRTGTKVGEVLISQSRGGLRPDGRTPGYRTDIWVSEGGKVVMGGYQCPRCKHRSETSAPCVCGGKPHRIHIPLEKGGEDENLLAEAVGQAGPAPVIVMGVVREESGKGLMAQAKAEGKPPMALIPEGGFEAADFLANIRRDLVTNLAEGEEGVIIPLSFDAVATTASALEENGVESLL